MKRLPTFPFAVVVASLLAGLSFAVASTAAAESKGKGKGAKSDPAVEAKEAARAAYGNGQAAFNAGKFDEAATAFEAAYAAIPNPIVLLSISESRAKVGQIDLAIAALQKYLAVRADAPDKADVEAKLKALSATPAHVAVTSEPAGADLDLDGSPTQKQTPVTLELSPGSHELHTMLRGYHSETQSITVTPGGTQELAFTLNAAPPEAAPVAATSTAPLSDVEGAPEPSSGRPMAAIWVTGSIGAAALIAGSVLGFMAVKEHSDFEHHPTTASADRGERYALFADVGFGVGAMAIATAAVLYLTSSGSAHAEAPASARLELTPGLTPSSASASARLLF